MSSRCFARSDLISVKNHFTSSRSSYNRCNTRPLESQRTSVCRSSCSCPDPISWQRTPNKREFSGRDLMRFIIFTDWFSTESKRTGIFLAASASRWTMQCVHFTSGATCWTRAARPRSRPVIACAPSVHRPTHRSQAKPFSRIKISRTLKMASPVVCDWRGRQNRTSSSIALSRRYLT